MEMQLANIIVREAKIQDIDSLINLRKYLLSEGAAHYVSKNYQDEIEWQIAYKKWLNNNISSNERILIVVAYFKNSDRISACGIGVIDNRAPLKGCLNGLMGWVQTVVVHPSQRKKGLGENIMHYILEWFKKNNVGKVILQTTPAAKRLYEKIGFGYSGEETLLKEIYF